MIRPILQAVRRLLLEIDLRLSSHWTIEGVSIHNTSNRVTDEVARMRAAAAFDVLKTHDSRRFGLVKRSISRIVIAQQPYDSYLRYAHACALSDQNLVQQDPAWTAGIIIHEAIHARLHSRGISPASVADRRRIEALCVKEQRRFLAKVPNTEQMIVHLNVELQTEWFSDEGRHQAQIDKLKALDAPEWIIRWVKKRQAAHINGD